MTITGQESLLASETPSHNDPIALGREKGAGTVSEQSDTIHPGAHLVSENMQGVSHAIKADARS